MSSTPKLTSQSVNELLDSFSSPSPTPGGGSAAALGGALATSLLAMVAGLPKSKTNTPEARTSLDQARAALLALRARFVDLVDKDASAYDLVVAAYKRPKETDEDKTARKAAIQDAMRIATEIPIETMETCMQACQAAIPVAEHGNPSAKSDLGVAVQLLSAALTGALMNVEVNIGSLTDPAVVEALVERGRTAAGKMQTLMGSVGLSSGVSELMQQGARRLKLSHGGT